MRARTTAVVLLALCAVAASAATSSAGAATRHRRQHGSVQTELQLRGSHGYKIQLVDFDFGHELVDLRVARDSGFGSEQSVDYSTLRAADNTAKKGLVNIRIGRFGRFRGHLVVTSTKTEAPQPGCKGPPATIERGVFVGSFRFRGEEGYSEARTSRAAGSITKHRPQICTTSAPMRHPGREAAAGGRGAGRPEGENKLVASDLSGTYFEAEQRDEKQVDEEITSIQTSISHKVGKLQVNHFAFLSSFATDLTSDFQVPNLAEPLTEATVAPPAPFTGSATFRSDGAKTGSWTGDLAVDFPGMPPQPLTGGEIRAGLCAGRAGCTKTLDPQLQPVLEAPPGTLVAVEIKK